MEKNTTFKKRNSKGITLIALVITIIVLLILAGVAIATLTGDNGVLTKASSSKLKNEQATVKERIILAYGEYQIEIKTSNNVKLASTEPVKAKSNSQTFLQYLESKEYINSDGIVNVKNLTGNKMTLGNGTGKSDVYIISLDEEENKYVLNYYDVKGNENFLWETKVGGNINEAKNYYVDASYRLIYLKNIENDEKTTFEKAYVIYNETKIDITDDIDIMNDEGLYSIILYKHISESLEVEGFFEDRHEAEGEMVEIILVKDGINYLENYKIVVWPE